MTRRCAGIAVILVLVTARATPAAAQTLQYRSPAGVEYGSQPDTGSVARAEQALAADPRNVERLIQLGLAQSGIRQFREAIQSFSRGLELAPENPVLYRWRGHRYLSVREFDRAIADLTRGHRLDSTNYGILYHLGIVRFARGDFRGAADAFTRALPRSPDAAERAGATDWLWMSLARGGQAAEAQALLDRRPDSLPVNNAYSQRLRLYRGQSGPDEVLTAADTSDVAVATLSYGVGNWHLVRGDTARAVAWFERSIRSGGWPAFGFILSEIELVRLRARPPAESHSAERFALSTGSGVDSVRGTRVAPEFFTATGLNPILGRPFLPADYSRSGKPVVLLGHALWQRRFQASPTIIGSELMLNGRPAIVVGIAPRHFAVPDGAELWVPRPPQEGFIGVPGGRIYYAIMGNGPGTPLVVIHGGPGSGSFGLKPWAALGGQRRVIRYDQLGAGKSDHPTDTALFTVDRAVRELQALRDSLGLREVHLYGRSWGAMLLQAYMGSNPAGVRSVVLSSPLVTTAQWERDADSLIRTLPDSMQRFIAKHEAAGTTDAPEYRAAEAAYYKLYLTREPRRSPADADSAQRTQGDLVYQYMWGPSEFTATGTLKRFDGTRWLRGIRVPTLFVTGEFDEATPSSTARFAKLVRGADFRIIPKSGHSSENDNPEALLRTVREFLERVEHPPRP